MPVPLSRFVRVMSGGLVVTDELVRVRTEKTQQALDDLQGEIDRLAAAGLSDADLTKEHADLDKAKRDAVGQRNNKAKCEALEPVKGAAREAAKTAKDTVDALIERDAQKVQEIDEALRDLDGAIGGIGEPAEALPSQQERRRLGGLGDTLKRSTAVKTLDAKAREVDTLVGEIGTAKLAAVAAAGRVQTAQAAEVLASRALAAAKDRVDWLNTVATPNPGDTAYTQLEQEKGTTDGLAASARPAEYQRIQGEATTLLNELRPLEGLKGEIDTLCHGMTTIVGRFVPPDTVLPGQIATIKDGFAAACGTETTPGGLKTAAEGLKRQALALQTTVGEAQTARAAEALAAQALAAAKDRVDWLNTVATPNPGDTAYTQLEQEKGTADGLAAAAQPAAYQQVQGEATTLLNELTPLEALKGEIDTLCQGMSTIVSGFQPPDTVLPGQIATIKNGFATACGTEATAGGLKTAAEGLKRQALTLKTTVDQLKLAQDWKKSARDWLDSTKGWSAWVDGKVKPNAAGTAIAQLETDMLAAPRLAVTAQPGEYQRIQVAAKAVYDDVSAIYPIDGEIDKLCHAMRTIVGRFQPPHTTLPGEISTISGGFVSYCGTASTTSGLKAAILRLKNQALALQTTVGNEEAARSDLVKTKAAVADCLRSAETAIAGLSDPPKSELEGVLQGLQGRQTAALRERSTTTAKRLFLPLSRECADLLVRAKTAELKAKAGTPTGPQEIDDLVALLGKETSNPHDQALAQAALQARFKMDVTVQPGMKADRLPMLYKMLKKLPQGFAGHNELGKLEYGTEPSTSGNYHRKADPSVPGSKGVFSFNEMPENDQAYDFVNDSGGTVSPTYFKATFLHESGHGVDAQFSVMVAPQMAADGFGGWKKEDETTAANAYGAKLFAAFRGGKPTESDIKALALAVLKTGTATKPASATAPLGSLFDDWDTIMAHDMIKICSECRTSASPWNKGESFATRAKALDDRVYHEAYANDWYSYSYAARGATGVSSYQWRSPVEWFAELFALYHTKKVEPPPSVARYIKGP
ncbi:MAG TPA: hypothetical protein VKS60_06235 [Stellaceae bacterium]|nr:hypothetical protein [Stellaceae bacterium]